MTTIWTVVGISRVVRVSDISHSRYTYFIAGVETLQWLLVESGESEIADLDLTFLVDEDVGRLQVAMNDPVVVQVADPVRELPHERFENAERQLRSSRRVVVNDLL